MQLHEFVHLSGWTGRSLGQMLGVTQPTAWAWLSGKKRVPAERCPQIERITGGAVRCEDLRPDVEWHVLRHPGGGVAGAVAPAPADAVHLRGPAREAVAEAAGVEIQVLCAPPAANDAADRNSTPPEAA